MPSDGPSSRVAQLYNQSCAAGVTSAPPEPKRGGIIATLSATNRLRASNFARRTYTTQLHWGAGWHASSAFCTFFRAGSHTTWTDSMAQTGRASAQPSIRPPSLEGNVPITFPPRSLASAQGIPWAGSRELDFTDIESCLIGLLRNSTLPGLRPAPFCYYIHTIYIIYTPSALFRARGQITHYTSLSSAATSQPFNTNSLSIRS